MTGSPTLLASVQPLLELSNEIDAPARALDDRLGRTVEEVGIVAGTADHRIDTGAARQEVLAGVTNQPTSPALLTSVSLLAPLRMPASRPPPPSSESSPAPPMKIVTIVAAGQRVVAGAAVHRVIACLTVHKIITAEPVLVGDGIAEDEVVELVAGAVGRGLQHEVILNSQQACN